MKGYLYVIGFTLLTAFCWGVYGPVVQTGQFSLRESVLDAPGRLRAFICVGMAYFLIAVVVPTVWLQIYGEKGNWTATGFVWSFIAGVAGAFGALGIVLAFANRGNPLYVMPLVFGIAPVVNTFTTMFMAKTMKEVGPLFLAGLILVIVGAVTVLLFKPEVKQEDEKIIYNIATTNGPKKVERVVQGAPLPTYKLLESKEADGQIRLKMTTADDKQIDLSGVTLEQLVEDNKEVAAVYVARKHPSDVVAYIPRKRGPGTTLQWAMVILSIALTGVCWGAYGPTLHKGQTAMSGSRLRPFLCVGLAYLVVAVILPFLFLGWLEPTGSFNFKGTMWSLSGGGVGAIGALGIIMAFNFGGKPIFVMPIVFGLAPVINSFVELFRSNLLGEIGPLFYAGMLLVIAGAVTVLLFAPKAKPHGPAPAK